MCDAFYISVLATLEFFYADFNECENNASECGENSYCDNTIEGYECLCNDGFEKNEIDSCIGKPLFSIIHSHSV